jgi:hypothetical protein
VTWGKEDPDCRITAGQSSYFARSPVVGKTDTAATPVAVFTVTEWGAFTTGVRAGEFD